MSEWISVDRDVPGDGARVLTYDGYAVCASEFDDLEFHEPGCPDHKHAYITHWMPLPSPPEPPPAPTLTVKEALREAISLLDTARQSTMGKRELQLEDWFHWSGDIALALPRLRAALESEE